MTAREDVKAQLHSFIEEAPVAIAMFDAGMRYLAASRRWMEDYGLSEAVIGRSHYEIFPDIPERWRDAHRRGLAGETVRQEEDAFERDDAPTIWLKWEIKPWRLPGGRLGGIIIFTEDISRRKEAELQRDASIGALQASNAELDDFAHIVSHDLKEPLRGLGNHASFLDEDFGAALPEEGQRRLQRIVALTARMQQLIDDLLFFSRLGRSELAIQMADPNAMIRDVEQMIEALVLERRARIVVPAPMPQVLCDRVRLTEAFRNLVTNALKYNDKERPLIEVGFLPQAGSGAAADRDVFYVKDNGPGIPAQFHTDIFRMFRRLENAAAQDGTGAGLAFVKKIVERHGGRIWLESQPGAGTTFYFTLPQPPATTPKRPGD